MHIQLQDGEVGKTVILLAPDLVVEIILEDTDIVRVVTV